MKRSSNLVFMRLMWSAVLSSLACRRDPVAPEVTLRLTPCATVDLLAVGPGVAPSIRWSPDCGLGSVYVERAADSAKMWAVYNDDNQLGGPIAYGIRPNNAWSAETASPLVSGHTYRLYVGRALPPPRPSPVRFFQVVGQSEFTP